MTKYEWEKELKRNLARLPAAEQNRALAFYDELFADKIEQGYSEREVVREFGNPFDVATAIIRDYESEGGTVTAAPPPPGYTDAYRSSRAQPDRFDPNTGAPLQRTPPAPMPRTYSERDIKRARRGGALGAFLRVLFFIPYVVLVIVMISLLVAFAASAVGCMAGGAVMSVWSFTMISASGAVFAVELGMGLAAIGAGALLMMLVPVMFKTFKGISAAYLGIRNKKEVY